VLRFSVEQEAAEEAGKSFALNLVAPVQGPFMLIHFTNSKQWYSSTHLKYAGLDR